LQLITIFCTLFALVFVLCCILRHVLFVSHETFCFYQTVYIFIYSAYKLQVCSLNFCSVLFYTRRLTGTRRISDLQL